MLRCSFIPSILPKGELGWHMDIPKKGVSMEEVIGYRALQKARSGSEEEIGLLFFLFKYFASMYSVVILQTTVIHGYFL